MKKVEKSNLKFNESIMKMDIECFGYNNLLQDFEFMKNIKIAMDVFDEITGGKKVFINRKIRNSIFSILIFENIITLLSHQLIFKIC